MGGGHHVYRIYRGPKAHYLLRAGLPSYSNASIPAEDKSYQMLEDSFAKVIADNIKSANALQLVGESEETCPDDEFYFRATSGAVIPLCFAHYENRKPWCIFAVAKTGTEFWKKIEASEDYDPAHFAKPAIRIQATYLEADDNYPDIEVEEIGGKGLSGVPGIVKKGVMVLFLLYGLYRIFSGYLQLD